MIHWNESVGVDLRTDGSAGIRGVIAFVRWLALPVWARRKLEAR